MQDTKELVYRGYKLRVTFNWTQGFRGSVEEPPEGADLEVEKVELNLGPKPIINLYSELGTVYLDITDLLDEAQREEIALAILEGEGDGEYEAFEERWDKLVDGPRDPD